MTMIEKNPRYTNKRLLALAQSMPWHDRGELNVKI